MDGAQVGTPGIPSYVPEVLVVTDKKPAQLAIRLPLIIVVALLVMLAIGIWAFHR